MFIFAQVTMETSRQEQPSTIYFVEEMKPEYLDYIDSCKERAQTDSAYWQELKESMSRGMIHLTNDEIDEADIVSEHESTDMQYDESSEESIRSLLEYQIKMLENMNYAIDMLTEKCDELTKYCSKLAKRLKKYGVSANPIDVSGIINSDSVGQSITMQPHTTVQAYTTVNRTVPALLPVQSKPVALPQSETNKIVQNVLPLKAQSELPSKVQSEQVSEQTHVSDLSVTDETDESDADDFTETNNVENTNVKQVDV